MRRDRSTTFLLEVLAAFSAIHAAAPPALVNYQGVLRDASDAPQDAATPVPEAGLGYFYLVTAENRIDEEGTKGFQSSGAERANPAPCP